MGLGVEASSTSGERPGWLPYVFSCPQSLCWVLHACAPCCSPGSAHVHATTPALPCFVRAAPGDAGGTTACQVSDFCQGLVRKVAQHDWPTTRIARVLAAMRDFPL